MKNKKISIAVFIVFIFMVLAYALYTAKDMIYGPRLMLDIPGGSIEVTSQVIEISGSAINAQKMRINNKEVLTDQSGKFAEKMLLSVGVNTFDFTATDKFGNTKSKVLQVIYSPPQGADVLQLKDTN